MTRTGRVALAALLIAFSGCLDGVFDEDRSGRTVVRRTASPMPAIGNMSAEHAQAENVGACPSQSRFAQCATRTHWVHGELDLKTLPIDLRTFNGLVSVQGGLPEVWNVTVRLTAGGDTAAAARANVANIEFTWSHEDRGGHYLKAKAQKKNPRTNFNEGAQMELRVPASVLIDLTARSSNGQASAQGIRASWVELATSNGGVSFTQSEAAQARLDTSNGQVEARTIAVEDLEVDTSNGGIDVEAQVGSAHLSTSNGQIKAKLIPSASGTIVAKTSNGQVRIQVPESPTHGYQASVSTSLGEASVGLTDGALTGSKASKQFTTNEYSKRELRMSMTLTTSNGNAALDPL